jgi:hypothetical protein
MQVRIYKSFKNPMQSGNHKNRWILESNQRDQDRFVEPIMGRTSSKNMMNEIRIEFENIDEAVKFAVKNNYVYEIIEPKEIKIIKKSYASNFK